MEENQGANGVGTQPEVSPPQNEVPVGQETPTSRETINNEEKIPYHQVKDMIERDSDLKDYIVRQYARPKEEVVPIQPQQQKDEYGELVQEVAKTLGIDEKQAAYLVQIQRRTVEIEEAKKSRVAVERQSKINRFKSTYPDYDKYVGKVLEYTKELSPQDQENILNSETMLRSIFDMVKAANRNVAPTALNIPPVSPVRGTSPSGRAQGAYNRSGTSYTSNQVTQALRSNDKESFYRAIANIPKT